MKMEGKNNIWKKYNAECVNRSKVNDSYIFDKSPVARYLTFTSISSGSSGGIFVPTFYTGCTYISSSSRVVAHGT
jgi:hypothetical protein